MALWFAVFAWVVLLCGGCYNIDFDLVVVSGGLGVRDPAFWGLCVWVSSFLVQFCLVWGWFVFIAFVARFVGLWVCRLRCGG